MTRLICSILAAGSAAISMAAPASAHEMPARFQVHQTAPVVQRVDYDRYRAGEWRELQMARHRFYGREHSRWERARFDRWYERRCEELRHRGY